MNESGQNQGQREDEDTPSYAQFLQNQQKPAGSSSNTPPASGNGQTGSQPIPAPPQAITSATGGQTGMNYGAQTQATGGQTGTPGASGAQTQQDFIPDSSGQFGDLNSAQSWMGLVNDPQKLTSWIKANNPGWNDQLVNYYAGVIKGQPGANPTEQAGSAQYYLDKFAADPFYGGGGAGGASTGLQGGGVYVPGQGVPGMGTIFGAGGTTGSAAGNSLFDFLMQRAHQGVAPDPNDPIIKNQVGAFGAAQTRAARDAETARAERGGPISNQDAFRRSASEKVGQATSGYQAQLLGNEVAARRQEIAQALSGAQGFLTDSQRAQLQEELAQLQLGQGAYQFDTNMQFMNSPLYGGGY
jgi:hypothetical protein